MLLLLALAVELLPTHSPLLFSVITPSRRKILPPSVHKQPPKCYLLDRFSAPTSNPPTFLAILRLFLPSFRLFQLLPLRLLKPIGFSEMAPGIIGLDRRFATFTTLPFSICFSMARKFIGTHTIFGRCSSVPSFQSKQVGVVRIVPTVLNHRDMTLE